MKINNSRIVWVDLTKSLAIFMVIIIHSIASLFYEYSSSPFSKNFILSNFINSFFRVAVPLFILLSGVLALQNTMPIEKLWHKVKRLLIPLIFWSILYKYWVYYNIGKKFNIFSVLNSIIREPAMYHLGFVYYMLGVCLLFPILALIVNEMIKDTKFACYFLILWFVINGVNSYYFLSITNWMAISNFLNYSGYAVLGAYLIRKNIGLKFPIYYWLILYLIGSIITFIITWKLNINSSIPDETAYVYLTPNVIIASIGIFVVLQKVNVPVYYNKLLKCISNNCFFIYFFIF
ncbi:MAG: acyltransferase family protein [Rickettsia endosymbiont of Ecitomorpha arachnoides]|nr:acyltransferase family protein [Rickettsia endosymbiont of Sceptobius lativentris]MCC8462154.1 acyltransferase family protein [Rickettsia endosymbiont of Ecitomorpha arachnoides]